MRLGQERSSRFALLGFPLIQRAGITLPCIDPAGDIAALFGFPKGRIGF